MKNIQRDSKYIIKRILIGVGIAIVLFNLKKCNVYADVVPDYYIRVNNGGLPFQFTTTSSNYNQNDDYSFFYNNKIYHIVFRNDSPLSNVNYIYMIQEYNNQAYLTMWYVPDNYTWANNSYFSLSKDNNNNPQFPPNIKYVWGNDINNDTCFLNSCNSSLYTTGFGIWDNVNGFYYRIFKLDTNIDTNTALQSFTYSDTTFVDMWKNHLQDMNIISNSPLPIRYGFGNNATDIYSPNVNPLSNYTEVDITGKEAILIVPKSYLQLSNTDYYYNENTNELFIDLKYGYERCIRSTLVDITNVSEFFTVDSWLQGFTDNPYDTAELCGSEPTLTYSRYLYNSPEMEAMGHPYGYMALLLYNNSIDYSSTGANWINNQHNPYGANSVWVNTELYNYYLIDNLKNFNQTINYKDSSGDDQSTYIETLPTFEEQIESSLNQWDDNSSSLNTSRIESLITFLKIPFTFIRSFNSDSCQPIILPLPKYGNISVPCVKSLISEKLGNNFLTILQVVINGVLIYRITILNIECVRQMLDPVDDKLEVLEL